MSATVDKQPKNNATGGVTGKGFVPGVSGNPKGRPKGSVDIWGRVRAKLREKAKGGKGELYADRVASAIVRAALNGRWPQTKELLDREHGKPAEAVTHTGGLEIKVVYVPVPANGNGRITATCQRKLS